MTSYLYVNDVLTYSAAFEDVNGEVSFRNYDKLTIMIPFIPHKGKIIFQKYDRSIKKAYIELRLTTVIGQNTCPSGPFIC